MGGGVWSTRKSLTGCWASLLGKKPNENFGDVGLVQELTKRLVEPPLEADVTSHLGYEKHEERPGENARNSFGRKRLKNG